MIKEIRLPELSENIQTADVVKVLVAVGDVIRLDQPILELETDKAMFELPSSEQGTVAEIGVKAGETVRVGQVLMLLQPLAGEAPVQRPEPPASPGKAAAPAPKAPVTERTEPEQPEPPAMQPAAIASKPTAPAAPSVRRLARELGVDISRVTGSGPRGRIAMDDVKAFAKTALASPSAGRPSARPLPDFARWGTVRREPMSKVRRLTADAMSHSWSTVPQVTQYDRADITRLESIRKHYADKVGAAGGKLTVTAVLLKVVAAALKAFPQFNASLDRERDEIIYKDYVDVGVAVDTDRGLLVPVVRGVEGKNITALSVELDQLAEKARTHRIVIEELEGGNFTISNLGGIGGVGFSPIVYWPQVAILGVSRASMEPVHVEGAFHPRLILPLSLSYDHRLIDGADGARFLRWICEAMEEPFLLALEG
jgi:pyruvate dehydrogenase E2 component (dihydrolipoamide acetyltransferase)